MWWQYESVHSAVWLNSVYVSWIWSHSQRLYYVIMMNKTALQNSKLQTSCSLSLHQNHHKHLCIQSWVTFELHHTLVLLFFDKTAEKVLHSQRDLPVFQTFKIPFQTMSDLSWHTCKPPLHSMCLASKVQHERDHLLLHTVPCLNGSFWASEVQHSYTNQPYVPCVPWAWLQCSMIKEVLQLMTLMLNCSHHSLWEKSVWTNPSKKSPSRGRSYLGAETHWRLFYLAHWIAVYWLRWDTSLEQSFWPWCLHYSPPAIRCQLGPLLSAPTSCLLCQLFWLTLLLCSVSQSAISRLSPICSFPLLLFSPP